MKTQLRSIKTVVLITALFLSAIVDAQLSRKGTLKAGATKPTAESVQSNGRGILKAGAAKVDITPTEQEVLNAKMLGIVDRIHVMGMINNVGMVCTNDLVYPYEREEIHPLSKLDVARRLSYWALHNTYGFGDALSVIGPQYKSMKVEKGRAILSFPGVDGEGITIKGDIIGFEIAGSDHVFYPATAIKVFPKVTELTVFSDKVMEPVAVRYCFKNFSIGSAGDVYGQPMVPFRTDIVTVLEAKSKS